MAGLLYSLGERLELSLLLSSEADDMECGWGTSRRRDAGSCGLEDISLWEVQPQAAGLPAAAWCEAESAYSCGRTSIDVAAAFLIQMLLMEWRRVSWAHIQAHQKLSWRMKPVYPALSAALTAAQSYSWSSRMAGAGPSVQHAVRHTDCKSMRSCNVHLLRYLREIARAVHGSGVGSTPALLRVSADRALR